MREKQTARSSIPPAAAVRAVAAGAAVLTVAAGLGVRTAGGGEAAKYAGDALYTVLIHTLVVLAVPRTRPRAAAGAALALSWAVELAQLTGVPERLAAHSTLARLVLGTTFNAPDLLWYAVGAASAGALHTALAAGSRAPGGPIPSKGGL
ncbi:DUF2809 domain-containing protein [Streptomyces nitrosporeus]|uniref:ribosomal maturation YjgA family protein n=1 Tax=Streptomyces nitrosporeus TaxID=28894 RepID=UPI0033218BC0